MGLEEIVLLAMMNNVYMENTMLSIEINMFGFNFMSVKAQLKLKIEFKIKKKKTKSTLKVCIYHKNDFQSLNLLLQKTMFCQKYPMIYENKR